MINRPDRGYRKLLLFLLVDEGVMCMILDFEQRIKQISVVVVVVVMNDISFCVPEVLKRGHLNLERAFLASEHLYQGLSTQF